jgi:hypothetical protein
MSRKKPLAFSQGGNQPSWRYSEDPPERPAVEGRESGRELLRELERELSEDDTLENN